MNDFCKIKKKYKKMHTTKKKKATTHMKNKGKSINSVVKCYKISRFISLDAIYFSKNAENFARQKKCYFFK